MTEYEYQPLKRWDESAWQRIRTRGAGNRAYVTLAAARGVLSREKREDRRRAEDSRRMASYRNEELTEIPVEYKVQRRPLGDWEDVD